MPIERQGNIPFRVIGSHWATFVLHNYPSLGFAWHLLIVHSWLVQFFDWNLLLICFLIREEDLIDGSGGMS